MLSNLSRVSLLVIKYCENWSLSAVNSLRKTNNKCVGNEIVGIKDGIKPRIRIINPLKTAGYSTYSDGGGPTNFLLVTFSEVLLDYKLLFLLDINLKRYVVV